MVEYKPDILEQELDQIFYALSDSNRRSVLYSLSNGSQSMTQILDGFDISFAGLAKHVNILVHAGLVEKVANQNDKRSWQLRVKMEELEKIKEWVGYHEKFWGNQLDNLEKYIMEKKNAKNNGKKRKNNKNN